MSRAIEYVATTMGRGFDHGIALLVSGIEGFIELYHKYKIGPIDLDHHSKWPHFLRFHGSITPELILPLFFTAVWATAITCFSEFVLNIGIQSTLLTVLGLVISLSLSFRSTTAYERYNDGRKYWAQLTLHSQNFARIIWIHVDERHTDPALEKADLLAKINCLNLITAYAFALKHRLRFEPYIHYDVLRHRIGHLDTYARAADVPVVYKKHHILKTVGQFLGVPMAESNPRKAIKEAKLPLGNLPLEILTHLSSYIKQIFDDNTLHVGAYQSQVLTSMMNMHDVLTGTDRILTTPLPLAYSIAIAQITYVYIFILPFQLYTYLGWVTIPASVFAAYIILGLAFIGREIENPFGSDVNDLPLDSYCEIIRNDVDLIMSKPVPVFAKTMAHEENQILYPLSPLGSASWTDKSIDEIRAALAGKPGFDFYHTVHTRRLHRTYAHKAEEGEGGVGHDGSADEVEGQFELKCRRGY